jgi:thiol peroxidase
MTVSANQGTTIERSGAATFRGRPVTVLGPALAPGDTAPDFAVIGTDTQPVTLGTTAGKVRIISAVPSLETPVCDQQARRFHSEAAESGGRIVAVTISADLPFAQRRWCGAAGFPDAMVASDHFDLSFARAYGVLVKELRLLARAVFVVDAADQVVHAEYVPAIEQHPDYDRALAAARAAAG